MVRSIKSNRAKIPSPRSLVSVGASCCLHVCIAVVFSLQCLFSLEIPLEVHGRGFLGKYLNSDTTRYNMDASIDFSCTILRHRNLSLFIRYRDDLDLAQQEGGVSLDPRYAHYYIVVGVDYMTTPLFFSGSFIHDCIHDIDYEVEGTPVFNRFRLQLADAHYHRTKRLETLKRFIWNIEVGFYPHWYYHGWVINFGADYNYEVLLSATFNVMRRNSFGIDIDPRFYVIRGDTSFYHQHVIQVSAFYRSNSKQIGLALDYNIWNDDPIKNPDKLWLLSFFIEF
jgi:hypothetical protein